MRPLDIREFFNSLSGTERTRIEKFVSASGGKLTSFSAFTTYHCLRQRLAFVDQGALWGFYDELIKTVTEDDLKNESIMDRTVFDKIGVKYGNYLGLYVRMVSGMSEEDHKIYDQIDEKISDWIFEGPQYKRLLDIIFDPSSINGDFDFNNVLKNNAKDLMPFVIHEKPILPRLILEDLDKREELDVPFKVCSFESDNMGLVAYSPTKAMKVSHLICVVSLETSPKNVKLFGLWVDVDPFEGVKEHLRGQDPDRDSEHKTLGRMLDMLERCPLGHSRRNEMFKFKKDGVKTFFKIKEVIHIGKTHKPSDFGGYGISWNLSHRTDVRGHWRTLQNPLSLGKDRADEYVVPGFTWVRPYIKGDESLPYIKKVRHVHAEQPKNTV